MDAAFVAANAGEYKTDNDPGRFSSDGRGSVSYSAHIRSMPWAGVHFHMEKGTRFIPLFPLPSPLPDAEQGKGETEVEKLRGQIARIRTIVGAE